MLFRSGFISHYDNGPAENAIMTLRNSANSMMLTAQMPWRLWDFAIQHAAYLRNITIPSRADPNKSIYELLTGTRANLHSIPPLGAFACIYHDRRKLNNQSLGLPSIQGAFIGICTYRKILGYCIFTADQQIVVTRHNITCDPYLYPFKTMTKPPTAWRPFVQLTSAPIATTPLPDPLPEQIQSFTSDASEAPLPNDLTPSPSPPTARQRMNAALADDADLEISDDEEEPTLNSESLDPLENPRPEKRARKQNSLIGDLPDTPRRVTKLET